MKKYTLVALLVCLSLLFGCSMQEETQQPQTQQTNEQAQTSASQENETVQDDPYAGLTQYTSDTGISLYMADGFSEMTVEGVTCSFNGETCGVSCREELFADLESVGYDDLTLEEYATLIRDAYELDSDVMTDTYGNVYICYEQQVEGASVTYYAYFDMGAERFWTTNFICITDQKAELEDDFALWASSIVIE